MAGIVVKDKSTTGEDVERIKGLLTTEQVAKVFGKTVLTVLTWRKEEGLPYVVIPGEDRHTIRFRVKRVRAWADKQGRQYDADMLSRFER